MNEFFQFLIANWYLTALFLAILIAIIVLEIKTNSQGADAITPEHMTTLINREHAIVFDTREQDNFTAGHVAGAVNFQVDDFQQFIKKYKKSNNKPVVVVDKDGRSFQSLIAKLKSAGFTKVFGLVGGIEAWKAAGYPLVKDGE